MNIFLDANILVSVLNKEYPLFTYSSRILSLADHSRFKVYTSPLCLAIAFYFAEKKSGTKAALEKIHLLVSKIRIADMTGETVLQTVSNSKVKDFEDGLEYYSAVAAKCTCIITNDVKDFYFSEIEVLNADVFFEKYLVQ
jgi:predicted nucleic acid-binding protein